MRGIDHDRRFQLRALVALGKSLEPITQEYEKFFKEESMADMDCLMNTVRPIVEEIKKLAEILSH